jgi:hypothetical protein
VIEEDTPDIIETLRECAEDSRKVEGDYYADQFATEASVFDDAADAIEKLRDEIARLRLTDWEREAIVMAASVCDAAPDIITRNNAAMLRSLLSRTDRIEKHTPSGGSGI